MAFAEISPKAIQKLFDLLECNQPTVQLGAAREILDRHLGRPRQGLEVTGANSGPIVQQLITADMSMADAARIYADSLGGPHAAAMIAAEVAANGHDDASEGDAS